MKKYIEKPVVIEAVQFTETNLESVFDFIGERKNYPECQIGGIDPSTGQFKLKVFDFVFTVNIGDYIVKEKTYFVSIPKKQFDKKYIEFVKKEKNLDEFCIPSYKNAPPPPDKPNELLIKIGKNYEKKITLDSLNEQPKPPTPESQGLVKPVPPQPRYIIENPNPVTFPQLLILCAFCLVIIILGMLSGCTIEERQRGRSQEAKEIVNNLTYVQDKRTGLCFGVIYPDRQDQSLTLVPCEKVEKYLK